MPVVAECHSPSLSARLGFPERLSSSRPARIEAVVISTHRGPSSNQSCGLSSIWINSAARTTVARRIDPGGPPAARPRQIQIELIRRTVSRDTYAAPVVSPEVCILASWKRLDPSPVGRQPPRRTMPTVARDQPRPTRSSKRLTCRALRPSRLPLSRLPCATSEPAYANPIGSLRR